MATLILGNIGGRIGGPLGALIAAQLGNRLDRRLLGGRPRRQPLDDNRLFLDSSYGAPIPLVYGRARVAGHVVWASGIDERRRDRPRRGKGGGGGGGGNTKRSYFVSLAVAVSARPILRIERIWADGKLLVDADGGRLVPFEMTVHPGGEEALADPVIQGFEGAENTPPMRRLAHVVIEDLPLAEFGNRIPNLSFEVVADETLELGALLVDLAARAGVAATASPALARPVTGLAIVSDVPLRAALEAVIEAADVLVAERPGALAFLAPEDAEPVAPPAHAFGAGVEGGAAASAVSRMRRDGARLPVGIDLAFLDPARDYQRTVERARRRQAGARRVETLDTALVLEASRARAEAHRILAARVREAERVATVLPLADALAVEVGDRLALPDGGEMLVMGLEAEAGRMMLEGAPAVLPAAAAAPPPGTPGFPPLLLPAPGPTRAHLLDFPGFVREEDEPVLPVALAGPSAGWRSGALFASSDGGESFAVVAETAAPAVIGDVEVPPGPGPTAFWDEANSLVVRLLRADMTLESRSALAVLNGANLAMAGGELLQFRNAVLQADGSYLLTGLLRGRQGSEHAVAGHVAGEPFVLVDGGGLADARIPLVLAGTKVLAKPVSDSDDPDAVAPVEIPVALNALKPLSPVHVKARRLAGGDVEIAWIRRTRRGGAWLDGTDVPLGEECACYEVEILDGAGAVRRVLSASGESVTYTAAAQQADFGALPASLAVRVYQLSTRIGRGWPAEAVLAL